MDYKEKYEMALEGIQEILSSGEDSIKMSRLQMRLQGIFPELKESEDERIRKELIAHFKTNSVSESWSGLNVKKVIAWLEKQGKQKSIDDLTQQEAMDIAVTKCFEQGEQKPTNNQFTPEQANVLDKHIDKLVEQKHDWSEEDDKILKSIIINIENLQFSEDMREKYHHIPNANKSYYQIKIDWLKSLKDRVQPKQEWSEEDKEVINLLLELVYEQDKISPRIPSNEKRKMMLSWLKSFKERYTWKPSDEHYELEEFAKIVRGNLTGISKAVQKLFEAKYLQLTGNKMYKGFKD